MTMLPFDPGDGHPIDMVLDVFPDAPDLIGADTLEHGRPDGGYFAVQVPETADVWILYCVDDATRTVRVLKIHTHKRMRN